MNFNCCLVGNLENDKMPFVILARKEELAINIESNVLLHPLIMIFVWYYIGPTSSLQEILEMEENHRKIIIQLVTNVYPRFSCIFRTFH